MLQAFSFQYGEWVKDAQEWIATGNCQSNTLTANAKAHAAAVASVLVSSLVSVTCSGQGFACGYSVAEGSALASSLAQAQARAFVDADPSGEHGSTFCDADVQALAEVYAQAAEKVRNSACVENFGTETKFTEEYASAIECAVATAYVRANAAFCESKSRHSCFLQRFIFQDRVHCVVKSTWQLISKRCSCACVCLSDTQRVLMLLQTKAIPIAQPLLRASAKEWVPPSSSAIDTKRKRSALKESLLYSSLVCVILVLHRTCWLSLDH